MVNRTIHLGKTSLSPYDADTDAWAAQVVTNGGTAPSATSKGYVDTLIRAIKADANLGPNLNSTLDRLWLLANADNTASATDAQALTSIVSPGTAATLSGTFTSKLSGYQSNGSTGFINSGRNPATAGGNYSLNSASIGTYGLTHRTGGDTTITIGSYDGSSTTQILANFGGGTFINGTAAFTAQQGTADGFTILSRTGASATTADKYFSDTHNTTVSDSGSSSSIPSVNLFICARNNQGTADSFTTDKLALAFIGGGLNATKVASLAGYVNTYMTSLGLAVHS